VLRDEGEAYAHKLANAGVRVTMIRALGTCHGFAMLNPLSHTPASRAAIQQTNDMLRQALHAATPATRAPAATPH
jgi:acetyl esterase